MGILYRQPLNENQRDRWLAILEVIENNVVQSLTELRNELGKRGFRSSVETIRSDLDYLHVAKVGDVYMQVSLSGDVELLAVLTQRLRAVCEGVTWATADVVVIKTNVGAAHWIAEVIKEIADPLVHSVMYQDDTIWLLVRDGRAEEVAAAYFTRWRGTERDWNGIRKQKQGGLTNPPIIVDSTNPKAKQAG